MNNNKQRRGDGIGCCCHAGSAGECVCANVDWTPSEVYALRDELIAMTAERDRALAELAALRHDPKADERRIIAEWRSKAESAWSAAHNAKEALRAAQAQRDELAALLQAAIPMILGIAPRVQRELLIGDIRAALARLTPTAPTNGAEKTGAA